MGIDTADKHRSDDIQPRNRGGRDLGDLISGWRNYVRRGLQEGDVNCRFTYSLGTRHLGFAEGFWSVASMDPYLPFTRRREPPPPRADWWHLGDDWVVMGRDIRGAMPRIYDQEQANSPPAPAADDSVERAR